MSYTFPRPTRLEGRQNVDGSWSPQERSWWMTYIPLTKGHFLPFRGHIYQMKGWSLRTVPLRFSLLRNQTKLGSCQKGQCNLTWFLSSVLGCKHVKAVSTPIPTPGWHHQIARIWSSPSMFSSVPYVIWTGRNATLRSWSAWMTCALTLGALIYRTRSILCLALKD